MKKYSVDDYLNRTPSSDPLPSDTKNNPTNSPKNKLASLKISAFGKQSLDTLGQAGDYLARLYHNAKPYQGVDLSQDNFATDIFRRQTGTLGKSLFTNVFGGKVVSAYQLASKFDQKDRLSALSDHLYTNIARLAQTWAIKSLSKDTRFGELSTLSPADKHALAHDIANQNRVLASMGGVAGFLGLKGVVLDTAWLLLISLKSVYQLAHIYDKPLTDKDGIRLAYGILSSCDLEKLQEKQVIMTALAVGDTLLKNAENTSLSDELKKLAKQYPASYSQKIDSLSDFVDLDKFNQRWLRRLLPMVSGAVAVHYNNVLLEEVLGVAQATFDDVAFIENKA